MAKMPVGSVKLQPQGLDWNRVRWGRPQARRSSFCSYCAERIPEEDCELLLWKEDGSMAQFCETCVHAYWFTPAAAAKR
jgi:hypothetical protein